MERRYQVFVSSTYDDLKEERLEVIKALLELDCIPAGMEYFPAGNEETWSYIVDLIDSCDYYIVIVGGRYGSVDEEGMSYTEREYRYAVSRGIPVAAFLHGTPGNIPVDQSEAEPEKRARLDSFKAYCRQRVCKEWSGTHELGAVVSRSVTQLIKRNPRTGWVRADAASESAARELFELRQTVAEKEAELRRLSLTAPEGADTLARGADLLEVEFKVTLHKENAGWDDPERLARYWHKESISWDDLFAACAPKLAYTATDNQMRADILRALLDQAAPILVGQYPGYYPSHGSVPQAVFQTIKVQFTALGLLESDIESRQDTHGTKQVRVSRLTPLGHHKMFELLAIRREGADEIDDES